MFRPFLDALKREGVPVSLREYLDLMAAMQAGLDGTTVEGFYQLARAILVKDERHIDRFDRAFAASFAGLDAISPEQMLDVLDLPFAQRSLANSAAVLMIPAAHMDWLRPGIMLYGASPFAELSAGELGLRPAMSLRAEVIALREVQAGETVGYGGSWQATHDTRIATVSCGYADGYPRHAPSGTPVWLQGQRVPLAGRVSMDMLCVDVGVLPSVQLGSAVELWGQRLPVDEVARAAGTLGYELLTRVTARVPRRY